MSVAASHLPASFRDPSGFLFERQGVLLRQVNDAYRDDYEQLMASGLYDALVNKGRLTPHTETQDSSALPELAYKVIRPERLPFISYPYEWCFSQLKDAALCTLEIQRQALAKGMTLKDASAYNIQFHRGAPLLIDTLSFARYAEGSPWIAYRQFCQHFLAPLALMSQADIRLNKLLQIYIDGVPLDLASKLLPWDTRFNFGLQAHIHLHAKAQQRYAGQAAQVAGKQPTVSRNAMTGLLDNLESTIRKLIWKPTGTDWVDYYQATNYSDAALEAKKSIVSKMLHGLAPTTILDLGANTGLFSRLGSDIPGSLVISTDVDPGAVELNYLEGKQAHCQNVLPLLLDLTNPTPAIGWDNTERPAFFQRARADVVMALALVHHLAISNNVPLDDIARALAQWGSHLIIEFVPKSDSQVQRLLASRADIFPDYTLEGFTQAFSRHFHLQQQVEIPGTQRLICLFACA
jgi:ribosomal protein L11 methylase PrmA